MLNKINSFILSILLLVTYTEAKDITGFWTTVNKKTGKPSSIIAVYPYEGNYYGRIIATYNANGVIDDTIYNPKDRAPGIVGSPYYSGLDIVWTTTEKDGVHKGYVVDPSKGKKYTAKLWKSKNSLILRGEVFVFGKNVTWPPFLESNFTEAFPKPDLSTFIPNIPQTVR